MKNIIKLNSRFIVIILLISSLPSLIISVEAEENPSSSEITYHVDINHPSASDSNDGLTSDTPWRTIGKAAETAVAGDTVHIMPGVYREMFTPQHSGSESQPITFQGSTEGDVIITAFDPFEDYVSYDNIHAYGDPYPYVYFFSVPSEVQQTVGPLADMGRSDETIRNNVTHHNGDMSYHRWIKGQNPNSKDGGVTDKDDGLYTVNSMGATFYYEIDDEPYYYFSASNRENPRKAVHDLEITIRDHALYINQKDHLHIKNIIFRGGHPDEKENGGGIVSGYYGVTGAFCQCSHVFLENVEFHNGGVKYYNVENCEIDSFLFANGAVIYGSQNLLFNDGEICDKHYNLFNWNGGVSARNITVNNVYIHDAFNNYNIYSGSGAGWDRASESWKYTYRTHGLQIDDTDQVTLNRVMVTRTHDGIHLLDVNGINITNCILHSTDINQRITLQYTITDMKLKNNLFLSSMTRGGSRYRAVCMYSEGIFEEIESDYNCYSHPYVSGDQPGLWKKMYAPETEYTLEELQAEGKEMHTVDEQDSTDPLPIIDDSADAPNYHPCEGSILIDNGDPRDEVPSGGGSRIDIGAYEYNRENTGPTQSDESPTNQSANVQRTPRLSVVCSDGDGGCMNATWWSNSTGAWAQFGSNNSVESGFSISQINSDFNQYATTYYWKVCLSDGSGAWSNQTYHFTTELEPNTAPDTPTNPAPSDNAINVGVNPTLSVDVSDPNGDVLEVTFYDASDDSLIGSDSGVPSGGIASTNWADRAYDSVYRWYTIADDGSDTRQSENWVFTTMNEPENHPPCLSSESPENQSIDVPITTTSVSIVIEDPDGDTFNSTIETSPDAGNSSHTNEENGTKTCPISNLDYDTTYTWYVNVTDGGYWTNHTFWFTTEDASENPSPDSPGSSGGQQSTPPAGNQKPTADASAGEPYVGSIGEAILFNGSASDDSDGTITQWHWDFGDGSNATGEQVLHTYTSAGIYTAILTVTDTDEATDTDETTVAITQPNRAPTKPTIQGPLTGTTNKTYMYNLTCIDLDNDTLRYYIQWSNSTRVIMTDFVENGTTVTLNHSWSQSGIYCITVYAKDDNLAVSDTTVVTMFIDAFCIGDDAYLLDKDGDGVYDAFQNNTSTMTDVQKNEDGTYLIDSDGDGMWNYIYNPTAGSVSAFKSEQQGTEDQGVWLFFVVCSVLIILSLCIVFLVRYFGFFL